jgi:radical SAM superfamily enzyme YgiQ (UPF0313 family)
MPAVEISRAAPKRTRLVLINFSDDFALGTRAIAAYVRKHGYRCDLVFMKRHNSAHYHLTPGNYDDLIALLRQLAPDVIGLSVATKTLPHAVSATERIRTAFPDALLLWGGWHPTMNPGRVLESVDIDAVGIGESEATMLEVLARSEQHTAVDDCHGLWVKAGGTIHRNPHRPLLQNLDDVPYFRYEETPSYLIDDTGVHPFDTLPTTFGRHRYGYAVMTSRGCPYNCSFCSVPFMKNLYGTDDGRYLRRRSVESVIAELEYARDVLGANYIWFFDEEMLFHRKWVRRFLEVYRDRIRLDYYCEAHPDSFPDDSFIDLLASSGLRDLEIGLQSASQETLKLFNRPHRNQDALVGLSKRLSRGRVNVTYDVILDNKLESGDRVRETLDYLLRLHRPFRVSMFPLAYRENYPLTETLLAKGLITPADYETDVLARQRDHGDTAGSPPSQAGIGEFPFVTLSYLNCLIYLTQVDLIPKAVIRRLRDSIFWPRHAAWLARLVMFLHRTRLAHVRVALRGAGRFASAVLRARHGAAFMNRRRAADGVTQ